MEKLKFGETEAIYFIEEKILMEMATENELRLYQDYKLYGKLKKMNYTYRSLIEQMRELFEITY